MKLECKEIALCFNALIRPVNFAPKLQVMDELEYILNDEGVVNSHGFVLLNAAGRFDRYNANPVMLFNHESGSIIGQMKGIRIDGTRLIGQPEFDEEDPLGLKCKRQAKKGILRGCSPGIIINAVEMRIGPDGEERLTVTDWELLETSLVGVPSNRNALRLYTRQGEIIPDGEVKLSVEALLNQKKEGEKMNKIILTVEAYTALGLDSGTEDGKAISAAIMELSARAERAEGELGKQRKERAESLVDLAIKEGRITADRKESFVKLALGDYETAKSTLEAIPTRESLSGKLKKSAATAGTEGREEWGYLRWAKEDPDGLRRMKADDPERFDELKARLR